jgi:hypothetical protein
VILGRKLPLEKEEELNNWEKYLFDEYKDEIEANAKKTNDFKLQQTYEKYNRFRFFRFTKFSF